jgi:signal peptidase S26 family
VETAHAIRAARAAGFFVLAAMPEAARRFAAARGYLPLGAPVVKRVAALTGGVVCADSGIVVINHRVAAQTLLMDRQGRPIPAWSGCRVLADSEVFLLMEGVRDSFRRPIFWADRRFGDHREASTDMDVVTLFAACALGSRTPLLPAPCAARPDHLVLVAPSAVYLWQPFIMEASQRFGIPEAWISRRDADRKRRTDGARRPSHHRACRCDGPHTIDARDPCRDTSAPRLRRRSRRPA